MYDVSSRTVVTKTTTGEKVGPNTYVLCYPPSRRKNRVPFLSSKPKSLSIISTLNTDAIYDVRDLQKKIPGGSSLRNTARRFVYKTSDVPPPTRYNPKPIRCRKEKLRLDPTKPKLYICPVPHSSSVIAPSIPTKLDENGYEIDDEGDLIKVPPDDEEPTDINIQSEIGKGKGWRWSCRSSRRFHGRQYETCGPGPAAYSLKVPRCRKAEEDERYREMARRFSFVPRFVEAKELRAIKENQPGPGSYDVDDDKRTEDEARSIHPKPFIRGAARFKEAVKDDTPGPTQYNVCDCSRMQKRFSVKCVPFGVEQPRFRRKGAAYTPGPGDYEIKGALQEKIMQKENPHALCVPPFNSTSFRDTGLVAKDTLCMPSAADYPEDKEEAEEEKIDISSSVFMNALCRFYSPTDKKDYIGPGKYNVTESFNKNQNRKSFSIAEVAFNSSGPRSIIPAIKRGVPCSTLYKTAEGIGSRGYHFKVSPRFTDEEETPGPGLYNIHPRYENATYKAIATHNLRLKEHVLRKKLRTAPSDTRKRWLATMKKTKLLKWFDVELDFEERMLILIQKLFEQPI